MKKTEMPLLKARLDAANRQAGADANDREVERDPIRSDAEGKHIATGIVPADGHREPVRGGQPGER
ncbi:hypothetical protein [Sphingomonas sp. BK235]|uniref:hypothetical protein n=1 Tax=Sphingomonas sp. BK235 TaxID=2512131 RepID=UPI001052C8DD|nr:hypothetical protein [Sphingomonas sp. BK235]TCP29331.1 hypothetical protein EV292_1198 [Sphingomonas sp. BK235]